MTRKTPPGRLTPREVALLTEYAQGGTLKALAGRLYLAEQTVRNQLQAARRRVGATTNVHLLALAIAEGDVPADVADGTAAPR